MSDELRSDAMDENNDNDGKDGENGAENSTTTKRTRVQRQKRFGVLLDYEDDGVVDDDEDIKMILEGEGSAIVVFKTNSALNAFIESKCKKPSGVEISKGMFRLDGGGLFKPIIGRDIMQKKSYN